MSDSKDRTVLEPLEATARIAKATGIILAELRRVVIGQHTAVEQLLIALFAGGHCLVRGGPGTAKTLAVSTLARLVHLKFNRVHCTPSLTPEEIVGREVATPSSAWEPPSRPAAEAAGPSDNRTNAGPGPAQLRFVRGPIFANIVLADEINRAPYQAQSAFLQPMQESRVCAAGNVYELDFPFLLVAAVNTHEQQSGFPLSDTVTDRFLMSIDFEPPGRDEELQIALGQAAAQARSRPVLRARDVLWIQQFIQHIPATRHLVEYAVDLVRATRPDGNAASGLANGWLSEGAGPRATACLLMAAKARAVMKGRCAVHAADIRAMLGPVLQHRLHLTPEAVKQGITISMVLERLLEQVGEPAYGEIGRAPPPLEVVDRGEDLPPTTEQVIAAPRAAKTVAAREVSPTGGPVAVGDGAMSVDASSVRSDEPVPVLQPASAVIDLPEPGELSPNMLPPSVTDTGGSEPPAGISRAPQMILPHPAAGTYYGPGQITMPYVMPVPYPAPNSYWQPPLAHYRHAADPPTNAPADPVQQPSPREEQEKQKP